MKICPDFESNASEWEGIGRRIGHKLIDLYIEANHMNNECLVNFMKNIPLVEELAISCCRISVSEIPLNLLLRLRKLSLLYSNFDEESVGMIYQLKNLTHFSINSLFDENIAKHLLDSICENLAHLKSLSITGTQYSSISALNKLKNLEVLEISFSDSCQLEPFVHQKLKSLSLENTSLRPKKFEQLVKKFKKLSKLCLNQISFVCECNSNTTEKCIKCNEKLLKFVSDLEICHLKLGYIEDFQLVLKFIPLLKNLRTIEISQIPEQNYQLFLNFVIDLANRNPKNSITVTILDNNIISKPITTSYPKNLKILKGNY